MTGELTFSVPKGHAMHLGPYEISIELRRSAVRPGRLGIGVVAALSALTLVALAVPAGADNVATGSVTVGAGAVRSVSVSPSSFDYSHCEAAGTGTVSATMTFPDAQCISAQPAVTITNGAAPATIDVQTSSFLPSDDLSFPWNICAETAGLASALGLPACSGATGGAGTLPGVDQASVTSAGAGQVTVGTTPTCDTAFDNSCSATGGQAGESETIAVTGPSASTDESPAFANTLTWTAAPVPA
jgi:hypothetical protein